MQINFSQIITAGSIETQGFSIACSSTGGHLNFFDSVEVIGRQGAGLGEVFWRALPFFMGLKSKIDLMESLVFQRS